MSKPTTKQIAAAIYELAKKTNSSDLAQMVASYVIAEHQTKNLGRIMRELERLKFERDGKLEVVATSAHALTSATKSEIAKLFDAKEKVIVERLDEALIGGVTLQALDNWLDCSIRGKLERLKNVDYQTSVKG